MRHVKIGDEVLVVPISLELNPFIAKVLYLGITHDRQLCAVLIYDGCVVNPDRTFRFLGMRWVNPFQPRYISTEITAPPIYVSLFEWSEPKDRWQLVV